MEATSLSMGSGNRGVHKRKIKDVSRMTWSRKSPVFEMKDYPFSENRRWHSTEGSAKSWIKEPLGMASGRSRARRSSKFWKWKKSGKGVYFKDRETRIIEMPLVVKCKICVSSAIYYFSRYTANLMLFSISINLPIYLSLSSQIFFKNAPPQRIAKQSC